MFIEIARCVTNLPERILTQSIRPHQTDIRSGKLLIYVPKYGRRIEGHAMLPCG